MPGWDCHRKIGEVLHPDLTDYPDWIDKVIDDPEEHLDLIPDEDLKKRLKEELEEYKKESKDIHDWICRKRLLNNLPENIRCLAVLHCIIDEFLSRVIQPRKCE